MNFQTLLLMLTMVTFASIPAPKKYHNHYKNVNIIYPIFQHMGIFSWAFLLNILNPKINIFNILLKIGAEKLPPDLLGFIAIIITAFAVIYTTFTFVDTIESETYKNFHLIPAITGPILLVYYI